MYQKWEEKFSVGVEKFDSQHKQILDKVNQLYDEIHGEHNQEILKELLIQIVTITEKHFADEEDDLKDKDYPELLDHIDEHKNLLHEIHSLQDLYLADRLVLDDEVIGFLTNWLSVHTTETDSGYSHLF